jgi:hypothetical protein
VRHKGKVIAHVESISLTNVRFLVGQSGNAKVRLNKSKCVHAGCSGIWVGNVSLVGQSTKVTYNPYKWTSFVRKDDESSIKSAKIAVIDASGILAVE